MRAYLETAASADASKDKTLIWVVIGAIAVYCILFLGSCSPLHCRVLLALFGLVCLSLAYISALSISRYLFDETVTVNHFSIPIILSIALGSEDLFLLCTSLDKVGLHNDPSFRIIEML